ncbi:MAG TPA: hydroxysqualene dehydroxylase HpnE [Vicinamibacterales bacterium]|nr:hydroxysqualene dehydroxylase HpnE [Vicinamibacterales bacterium]
MTSPDVVVIGAGFAGLSAASALAGRGARVLVLEGRPRLGGRATAFVDRQTGELVDNGQHVMFGCYRETLAFLRRIGAADRVHRQPSLVVPWIDEHGRRVELRCPRLPSPLHLLAGVLGWNALPWGDRLSVLRLARPLRLARRELERDGHVSVGPGTPTVAAWLTRYGQGPRLREWLWEPLAVAALNQSPETAGAEPFVRVLAGMFGSDPSDAALVMPAVPLHQMYAEPARTWIEARGGVVRTGALARVVTDADRVCGVRVRDAVVPVRRVVAAVPWHALRTLFDGSPPPALAGTIAGADAMQSMPIVTVNLWYDRQVMDDLFVGLPGRAMQWVFDKRAAFGGGASHLSLVASAADALVGGTAEDLVRLAAGEVAAALPGARAARLVQGTVIREKRATFSLAPGQPPRPGVQTALEGLVLAGDWIDTGLPGTIESAVVSGHRAARHLLETEGETASRGTTA